MSSPVGELRIVARTFGDGARLIAIDFEGTEPPTGRPTGDRADDDPLLAESVRQLTAYFAGERREFTLPLQPEGTEFQRSVWQQLVEVPYGATTTYGEIAARLGKTGHGARAVGMANGSNPIPIVIPCHRVLGADGSLTGYSGGPQRKQALLDLEADLLF